MTSSGDEHNQNQKLSQTTFGFGLEIFFVSILVGGLVKSIIGSVIFHKVSGIFSCSA